ncbi:MAG TPA: lysylphosphatidylglycerol synthase domain-containing protein [Desulfuromonadaceae bacterium]
MTPTGEPLTHMRRLNVILLSIAAIFLYAMLKRIGWSALGRYVGEVGRFWPLILVPYGVSNLLGAVCWKVLLVTDGERPSLGRLFFLRLAGESLNQLTPTASLGGEPFKALRLHAGGIPWQDAAVSLIIQKGLLVLSLVLYIFICIALVPFVLPASRLHLGGLGMGGLALAAVAVLFVVVQRSNPCTVLIRLLKRCGVSPALIRDREEDLALLDTALADFYRDHPGRLLTGCAIFFLGWVLLSVEVFLIFGLMGHPIGWEKALCLDGLAMLFSGAGFMIPVSLGVQDGGNVLLSLGFNLGAALGAAFSIIRRMREAFWLFLGLVVVAREK